MVLISRDKLLLYSIWIIRNLFQVSIITPFNFPLEIPVLQLMGALYMGNKPLLKVDSKVKIQRWEAVFVNGNN